MVVATPDSTLRDIELEVAYNVRHIGGYDTASGGRTAPSVVRSASLHGLTPASVGRLADLGVRAVVDLRSTVERQRDVTPELADAGIAAIHAPVFEQDASPVGLAEQFPGFATVYQRMLASGRTAYRVLFETVARTDGTVLFHCAAGKDRTGVGAALLLSVAGVEPGDIVADYARSAGLLEPMKASIRERMEREKREDWPTPERIAALMASHAADMRATLEYIEQQWDGAEGYLADIGLGADDLAAVRAKLLV
ncbi:MAG: tyrosine-protein phosphatase [Dehalococcoidia bacterium]|nr:tyrosine-protein phosphatase [Dehalococcoidia bacterium]